MARRTLPWLAPLLAVAGAAQEATPIPLEAPPTKQNPFAIKGKLTASGMRTGGTAAYSVQVIGGEKSYRFSIQPGTRLKVKLSADRSSIFQVAFLDHRLRTDDPGLSRNRINTLKDQAFYENRTKVPQTIYCSVRALEEAQDEPFTLTFTDF